MALPNDTLPATMDDDDGLDYGQMRAFLLALASFLDANFRMPTPMSAGIEDGIKRMEARSGPQKQLKGIRMAVGDFLEMTRDFTPQQVADADTAFAAAGAPLLSTMRAKIWRKVPKILARGKIRSEVEYYLVIERLNDMGPDGLEGPDRELADRLVAEFEERAAKRRTKSR
jgi:hypothetical protein